ncbi:MAG: ABC transporter permease [Myxococcales bacterium]|nr:ABC transporter permease [Myxococcales bacterium]
MHAGVGRRDVADLSEPAPMAETAPATPSLLHPRSWSGWLARPAIDGLDGLGAVVLFAARALWASVQRPWRYGNYITTMEFVGVGSAGIVLLTGLFTGAVFAIQTAVAFDIFNAKSLIGGSVALALILELAPTMGALMVAGRVGSAMCTELGTMRVTEQIDALETMAVDPVHYLVAPRLVACIAMMPMLAAGFCAIGLVGAYLVATRVLGVDEAAFFSRIYLWVSPADILCLFVKATTFGAVIGAIASYKGFHATGGSRGVGLATTSTVVTSSVFIFLSDYVITTLWMVWFPKGKA